MTFWQTGDILSYELPFCQYSTIYYKYYAKLPFCQVKNSKKLTF